MDDKKKEKCTCSNCTEGEKRRAKSRPHFEEMIAAAREAFEEGENIMLLSNKDNTINVYMGGNPRDLSGMIASLMEDDDGGEDCSVREIFERVMHLHSRKMLKKIMGPNGIGKIDEMVKEAREDGLGSRLIKMPMPNIHKPKGEC